MHGAIGSFLEIVERLGLVSGSLKLQMPDTDFVLVGDVCDRGYNSKDIYDLVIDWQKEAPEQGSRVWFLLGNHEVMNTFGLRHYNTAEEYLSYDASSAAAGRRAEAQTFAEGGRLYRWLCGQRVILRLGQFIFGHGDLPMALSARGVEEINERTMEVFRAHSGRPETGLAGALPDPLFSSDKSILWCRQAQLGRPKGYGRALEQFLHRNQASAYICGHTPAQEGVFRLGYENRYLCIDTAMTFEREGVGGKSALIIEGGSATAAYFTTNDMQYRKIPLSFVVPGFR